MWWIVVNRVFDPTSTVYNIGCKLFSKLVALNYLKSQGYWYLLDRIMENSIDIKTVYMHKSMQNHCWVWWGLRILRIYIGIRWTQFLDQTLFNADDELLLDQTISFSCGMIRPEFLNNWMRIITLAVGTQMLFVK